jgi:hypothetical protein
LSGAHRRRGSRLVPELGLFLCPNCERLLRCSSACLASNSPNQLGDAIEHLLIEQPSGQVPKALNLCASYRFVVAFCDHLRSQSVTPLTVPRAVHNAVPTRRGRPIFRMSSPKILQANSGVDQFEIIERHGPKTCQSDANYFGRAALLGRRFCWGYLIVQLILLFRQRLHALYRLWQSTRPAPTDLGTVLPLTYRLIIISLQIEGRRVEAAARSWA